MRYRVQYLDQYVVRAGERNTGMVYFIDLGEGRRLPRTALRRKTACSGGRRRASSIREPALPGGCKPRRAAGAGGMAEDQWAVSRGRTGRLHHDAGVERASSFAPTTQTVGILGYSKFSEKKFLKAGNFFCRLIRLNDIEQSGSTSKRHSGGRQYEKVDDSRGGDSGGSGNRLCGEGRERQKAEHDAGRGSRAGDDDKRAE